MSAMGGKRTLRSSDALRSEPIDATPKTAFHRVKSRPTYLLQLASVPSTVLGLLQSGFREENNAKADSCHKAKAQSGSEDVKVDVHPAPLLPSRPYAMFETGGKRTLVSPYAF